MNHPQLGRLDRSPTDQAARIAFLKSLTPLQRWQANIRLNEGIRELRRITEHLREGKHADSR